MYAEIIHAIDKVGLSIAKRPAKRYRKPGQRKLKRLRSEYIAIQKSKIPHQIDAAREKWREEADIYRKTLLEKQRR